MKIFTFEEWCEANPDLVAAVNDELHPSGVSWGMMVHIAHIVGDHGAFEHIESRLRSQYDAQVLSDKERLAKWNELVQS